MAIVDFFQTFTQSLISGTLNWDFLAIGMKFFISILSILNPLGAIPVFLSLTGEYADDEIKKISTNCAITIFITLTLSLLFGQQILGVFGISIPSFRLGGGILIGSMALNMLKAEHVEYKMNQAEIDRQAQIREIGVVPLAIPLLAGPGAISTSIISSSTYNFTVDWVISIIALLVIALIVRLVLGYGRIIRAKMGRVALNIMTRIMGLITLAISIEMISASLKTLFPGLVAQ